MIAPALAYKDEIEKKFLKYLYTEDAFWYTGYGNSAGGSMPEIVKSDGLYQWAIVDDSDEEDDVVGYIGYRIDETRAARNFGLFSFDRGNPLIASAILEIMQRLMKSCRRIEWRMIGGNPVQKHYDALCEKFGGTRLKLNQVCVDEYGCLHDEYIYEFLIPSNLK